MEIARLAKWLNLPERSGGNFNHFTFGECHEERGAFAKGTLVAVHHRL
jgi:hypothetical protein